MGRKYARIYYRKMKWRAPLLYDSGSIEKYLKIKSEPVTVIIGPDSRILLSYNQHQPEKDYITLMSAKLNEAFQGLPAGQGKDTIPEEGK